jgi:hypothetical protein
MPSWLVDDPTLLLTILGILALALAIAWWLTRQRALLFALAGVVCLAGLVIVLYYLIDTDAKQIERNLHKMVAGVEAKDPQRIFDYISDRFSFLGHNKASFRQGVEGYIRSGEVQGIKVWAFDVRELNREQRTAKVLFNAKGQGTAFQGYEYVQCKAVFVLDPDGQWRLKGFDLYQPQTDPDHGEPLTVPFRSH